MARDARHSLGARLYALLLYLYPSSFRREYGEAMLQLFNDQRRSANGPGGHAMLWLKTLRDLLVSVPDAHAHGQRSPSAGGRVMWSVVVVLGLVFLVNAVVLPSMISRVPSGAVAEVAPAAEIAVPGAYRTATQLAAAAISTLLALGALLFALRQRNALNGVAAFVAGAAFTCMALAMNPWLWAPMNSYPVSIAWAIGIWPVVAILWVALRVAARRTPVG